MVERIRRSGWLIASLAFLGAFGYLGVSNSIPQFPQATNLGQRLETIAELTYGVLALLGAGALLAGRRWALILLTAWGGAAIAAAGLAATYWGQAGWGAGVAAGLSAAVVALFVRWLAWRALGRRTP